MKSGWITSWTTANMVAIPNKDMLVITTADSFGSVSAISTSLLSFLFNNNSCFEFIPTESKITLAQVYKLSSIEIAREPPANAAGSEDAGGNVFEIKLGSTRWRIDGTQSQIWEFCKSYAEAAKTKGPQSVLRTTSVHREPTATKVAD